MSMISLPLYCSFAILEPRNSIIDDFVGIYDTFIDFSFDISSFDVSRVFLFFFRHVSVDNWKKEHNDLFCDLTECFLFYSVQYEKGAATSKCSFRQLIYLT